MANIVMSDAKKISPLARKVL